MQALKGLVAGLGALIVIGMALLVWGLYQKAENPDFKMFGGTAPIGAATDGTAEAGRAFGSVTLPLGPGCRVADMQSDSGRLYIRTEGGSGCDRVFIVDSASGAVLGSISAER